MAIRPIAAGISNEFNMLPVQRRVIPGLAPEDQNKGQARLREEKRARRRAHMAPSYSSQAIVTYIMNCGFALLTINTLALVDACEDCDTITARMCGTFHGGQRFARVARSNLGLLCLCACVPLLGLGTAAAAQGTSAGASGFAPRFAIADFDGDRKPDMATVEVEQDAVIGTRYSVRLQLSAGEATTIGITGPQGGLLLEPRDVNGDDAIDLIVTTALDSHFVAVLLNDGHGRFTQAREGEFPSIERNGGVRWNATRGPAAEFSALQVTRCTFGRADLAACGMNAERDAKLLFVGLHRISLAGFRQGKSGRSPPVDLSRS